ncbi:MAG: fatty acid oxidation complex subunit alpha FadB [SAR324 cluster bacterium]|nr:fatty acid oxidation complex subunit alpha FadB [SAR324 cluster bacterium]
MLFQGNSITCRIRDEDIAEIQFDLKNESVNKLNRLTLNEWEQALAALEKEKSVKGLLVTSGKPAFIVGADINEFLTLFKEAEGDIVGWLRQAQAVGNRMEDLPFPSVAAVNGFALGGGLEVAMTATYRVLSTDAVLGQPEVKLGLIPGFGGTVRLPRLIGADNAIELIASGRDVKSDEALKLKLAEAVVAPEKLEEAALRLLRQAMADERWKKDRGRKTSPILLNGIERIMAFTTAKGFIGQKAGPNYPAPVAVVELMEKSAADSRDAALEKEAEVFARLAKTPEAANLINLFHADQFLKKKSRGLAGAAKGVKSAAVLGAGIMGGGIAYQSASRGVPVIMKDIRAEAVQQGLDEAARLLNGQLERGRITTEQMAKTMGAIRGTLSYGDFGEADLVVEAVVENPKIKKSVLREVEKAVSADTVIATNTSTIPIDILAKALKRPERFCGMHFFNPVHRMPLVEVIRGKDSSDAAIGAVVAYALKMGKTPIVVNDCPGFLVNRILSPYMYALQLLVAEGAPIEFVDKTMEKFGWPMGPAHLMDVVGLDTAHHARQVMAKAAGKRVKSKGPSPVQVLFEAGYYGQKNGKGFYRYENDRKGKPQKSFDPAVLDLLKPAMRGGSEDISGEEIVERMMLPMVIEASRCLAENIVDTPTELDVSMLFGLGFPPFRGGLLRYADRIGLADLIKAAEKYEKISPVYQPTEQMRQLASHNTGFYG